MIYAPSGWSIDCDGTRCTASISEIEGFNYHDDREEVLEIAEERGWLVIDDLRTYCPIHRKEVES